jgi:signal transduction histidine kinase
MTGGLQSSSERTQLLAALLDETQEPVFALDEGGTIIYANTAAAEASGKLRRHLLRKPFPSLLNPADRRAFRTALAGADGSPTALNVSLAPGSEPVRLALRRLEGLQAIVVAAAGVRFAPTLNRTAERRSDVTSALDRFFLRFPYGVIGIGAERRVLFVNPRARHLLQQPELRIGRQLPATGPLLEFADQVLGMPSVARVSQLEIGRNRVVRAMGIGPRGEEPALLILEDVTERHRQDTVMREFLRNAAHQLRTPLTGIATAVEVLQAGAKNVPEERDRFLEHVEAHSRRLIRIARGLLVLARAQTGEPLRLEFVELRPLLEELAQQVDPHEGVALTVECEPTLAALAERDLAHEALAAIVENAVHHTREGTIRLSASEVNRHVEISITDGGGGVLPEHRDRIFEPFYRPAASGEGFGLGLAIAAQAVAAMDGRLDIEDAHGGSRFTITLPSARVLK